MRLIMILLFALPISLFAQDTEKKAIDHATVISPRKSFEAFIEAVLNEPELSKEERTARFNSYFDFENWLTEKEKTEGKTYSDEDKVSLKADWHTLFFSDEFRQIYKKRDIRVIEEPEPDWKAERAELVIAMKNTVSEKDEKFRVQMTLNVEKLHWSWYAIPRVESDQPSDTGQKPTAEGAERIRQVEAELEAVKNTKKALAAKQSKLEKELRRLKSEQVGNSDKEGIYSTPHKTVSAIWRAIRAEDTASFLRGHLERHRKNVDENKVSARLKKDSSRITVWDILDTTVNANDENRAIVRVKISFKSDGNIRKKTLSLNLVKISGEWLLNEEP